MTSRHRTLLWCSCLSLQPDWSKQTGKVRQACQALPICAAHRCHAARCEGAVAQLWMGCHLACCYAWRAQACHLLATTLAAHDARGHASVYGCMGVYGGVECRHWGYGHMLQPAAALPGLHNAWAHQHVRPSAQWQVTLMQQSRNPSS